MIPAAPIPTRSSPRSKPRQPTPLIAALILLLLSPPLPAVIEPQEYSSDSIRARYLQLTTEIRCPKCQNQNLAESDSLISADLRREILTRLESGHTDAEIRTFMQHRYGDFILYRPPLQGKTLAVWLLPAIFAAIAALTLTTVLRQAQARTTTNVIPDTQPNQAPNQ